MIKSLLAINIVLVLICIKKCCINHNRIKINHVFCFSAGYLYYCIVPFVCFEYVTDFPGNVYTDMVSIYHNIPTVKISYYLASILIIYCAFVVGSQRGKYKAKLFNTPLVFHSRDINFNYTQRFAFPIVVLLGIVVIVLNRASLFRGYVYLATDEYDSMRVLLSVYEFFITICVLYYMNSNSKLRLRKLLLNKWMIVFFFYSIILLTTGGRLYVVTALLSIIVFISFLKNVSFKVSSLVILSSIFSLLMGLIGISRYGFAGFNFEFALFNILEEPLYTNYSNLTYLSNYSPVNIFCYPETLFSAIINLLPTSLFPWKLEHIKYITDLYPKIEQPVGATHFYPTFNAGMGLVLSLLLFYCMGKWLGSINRSYETSNVVKRTIFCLVSANLVFTLFRDPMATSLMKNILEFSVIFPWLISAINDSLYKIGQ